MSRKHPLVTLETVVLVAMGGALGANVRYVIGLVVPGLGGTFVANVVGCFLLGFIIYEAQYTALLSNRSRLVFGTGFLSSLTTYSTFAVETAGVSLALGAANVVGNYAAGFAAVLIGRAVAGRVRDGSTTRVSD
jgi:CrcB protein